MPVFPFISKPSDRSRTHSGAKGRWRINIPEKQEQWFLGRAKDFVGLSLSRGTPAALNGIVIFLLEPLHWRGGIQLLRTEINQTVHEMSKQSTHLPVTQWTHHIPGHFFCLLCCCVQALLGPWVPINSTSNPPSVCLFLGESAPAEAVSPARCLITNN